MLSRILLITSMLLGVCDLASAESLNLTLRKQVPLEPGSKNFHVLADEETWNGDQTALIVCDVWDTHNCKNAAFRVAELVPVLNRVVKEARRRGVTIIHAPSNCMPFYEDHPARNRAQNVPVADNYPEDITQWCYQIPSEEQGVYPIDQSNGGCDDDPEEHAAWQASLRPLLEEEKWPWRRQHSAIEIDPERDYITDQGDEVWNILEANGLSNVIMTGVHTNMCVLGRPFGLRRLSTAGKDVVLMRDQTDTMYDPRSAPFVSHFTGTDLIVDHIERFVCPTILSTQLIGGEEFRFADDTRPTLAMLIAEDEYETATTLPKFAIDTLGQDYRVLKVFATPSDRNQVPGIAFVAEADALLVSARRRVLPEKDLKVVRDFVAAGKPVIGIRTASHAFSLRKETPPEGFADWKEFDAEVFGGNYTNHYGNQLKSMITIADVEHPVLDGIPRTPFQQGWSLYKTSPLNSKATVLMTGAVEGEDPEPVAWTFQRADGGRSFYTSLGHVDDFQNPTFQQLLKNGIDWTLEGQ
ncbi:Trehalose utilization [Thalassoglobus neptunius]|uniref:Trehalose utilization n=1 Tax=Thalassoglobus neptunius TaxID=1938619 RepID=A0A5C5X6Q1_9PLAN|nr:isochorismatase family protein [Thalassoglobus neptunius]TWT57943.1 Trehalose utilization [Thalassoglobus neptunius]